MRRTYPTRYIDSIGLAGAAILLAAAPAAAQTVGAVSDEIVVTATRLPTPLEQVGSSVSVVTAAEIERFQYRTLPEALNSVPGLNVAQSGPTGKVTSVFARGTNSNHVLVLLDGAEINDPSTPAGAFDFSDIPLHDVERIEVLRGSQSTVYGSDAIGAVVNIITKRGEGPPQVFAQIEAGSHGTFNQAVSARGANERFDVRVGVDRVDTDNQSITPKRLRPVGFPDEDDGFRSLTANAGLGIKLADNFRLRFTGRYLNTDSEIDATFEDPDSDGQNRDMFGRAELTLGLFDGLFENRLGVSYNRFDRESGNQPDALSGGFSKSHFDGRFLKFDWRGDIYLPYDQILTLGVETEEESGESSSVFPGGFSSRASAKLRTNSAYGQLQSSFGDRLFVTLGGRIDDHEAFGSEVTWRIAPTYLVRSTGTKLKGSYGTGFKAPTTQQLFGASVLVPFGIVFMGNPALLPETSEAWDIGFEQRLFDDRLVFGATYFDIDVENLIVTNATFTSLVNLGTGSSRGVEAFVEVRPVERLELRLDYTFTRAESANGSELLRRPRNRASLRATYRVTEQASLSAELLHVGKRKDVSALTFATITVPSYTIVNLRGDYRFDDRWRLFARIDNAFDRTYEPIDGFAALGIGAFVGVSARF